MLQRLGHYQCLMQLAAQRERLTCDPAGLGLGLVLLQPGTCAWLTARMDATAVA